MVMSIMRSLVNMGIVQESVLSYTSIAWLRGMNWRCGAFLMMAPELEASQVSNRPKGASCFLTAPGAQRCSHSLSSSADSVSCIQQNVWHSMHHVRNSHLLTLQLLLAGGVLQL